MNNRIYDSSIRCCGCCNQINGVAVRTHDTSGGDDSHSKLGDYNEGLYPNHLIETKYIWLTPSVALTLISIENIFKHIPLIILRRKDILFFRT